MSDREAQLSIRFLIRFGRAVARLYPQNTEWLMIRAGFPLAFWLFDISAMDFRSKQNISQCSRVIGHVSQTYFAFHNKILLFPSFLMKQTEFFGFARQMSNQSICKTGCVGKHTLVNKSVSSKYWGSYLNCITRQHIAGCLWASFY